MRAAYTFRLGPPASSYVHKLENVGLVTRASRLCGGNGIGLGGEESTTWKPSRLQGVGPMGMPADDPKGRRSGHIGKPTTGAVWPD